MTLRLVQFKTSQGDRRVAALDEVGQAALIDGASSVYELARFAISERSTLSAVVAARSSRDTVDLDAAEREGRLLAPIHHPDAAHLHLTGTGLTHLGSAEGRDKMHKAAASAETQTDSMRMFLMGVKDGKPEAGKVGAQPEWFYKGNGNVLVGPGQDLQSPAFA